MTAAIQAVMPVEGVLQQAAQPPQELHGLAAEFNRMMEHDPRALDYNRPDHNDHATVASEFLARQDRAMHQTVEDMHRFGVDAPNLSLPEMNGWEATRALKADPALARIPIVACTAHAMVGDRETAIAAGCAECLTKPYELDELIALVQRYVGPAQSQTKVA